jgi:hypothetical protein
MSSRQEKSKRWVERQFIQAQTYIRDFGLRIRVINAGLPLTSAEDMRDMDGTARESPAFAFQTGCQFPAVIFQQPPAQGSIAVALLGTSVLTGVAQGVGSALPGAGQGGATRPCPDSTRVPWIDCGE